MISHKLPKVELTISSTAIDLRTAIANADSDDQYALPEGANRVEIQAETNGIRYLGDGNTPTTEIGIVLGVGNGVVFDGDLGKLLMIADSGSDAKITVQVFTVYPGEH